MTKTRLPQEPGSNRLDDPGVEMQAGRQGAVRDARDERALPAIGKEPRAAQER